MHTPTSIHTYILVFSNEITVTEEEKKQLLLNEEEKYLEF